MKTLKKVLAVVLALAMVLGMAVTASAGYKDAEKINYKEAVEVMSLAGVLNGYTDGTFKPEGTLTRAEAAKMIVYMLGLEDTSLGYKANFGDINGHWAETPISVAAGLGIVAGMGNGQFVPNGTLTGFQWAKILLCAMGYDAEIEGMLGAGWEAKVAKLAKNADMVDGIKNFDGSKAVSREVAAKMAFNVLEKGFVGYPEAAQKAVQLGDSYYSGKKAKYGEFTCFRDKLELFHDVDVKANDWGRPGSKWYVNKGDKKNEDSVFVVADAEVTYSEKVNGCDLLVDLGYDTDDDTDVKVNASTYSHSDDKKCKAESYEYGDQGVLTEVYSVKNDKIDEYKVIEINTYLAKVTKVVDEKTSKTGHVTDGYTNVTVYNNANGTPVTLKKLAGYEKDDYILVQFAKNNVADSKKALYNVVGLAESIEGAFTDLTKKGVYTVAGEEYKAAKYWNLGKTTTPAKATHTWYLDQFGNLIGQADADKTAYAVITNVAWDKDEKAAFADVLYFDGTTETVEIETADEFDVRSERFVDNDLKFGVEETGWQKDFGLVSYLNDSKNDFYDGIALYKTSADEDGVVTFDATTYLPDQTINSKTTKLGSLHIDDATEFIVRTGKGTSSDPFEYTEYTGVADLPEMLANTVDLFYVADSKNTRVEKIYIKNFTAADEVGTYVFAPSVNYHTDKYGTYLTMLIDGKEVPDVKLYTGEDQTVGDVTYKNIKNLIDKAKTFEAKKLYKATFVGNVLVNVELVNEASDNSMADADYLAGDVTLKNGLLYAGTGEDNEYKINADVVVLPADTDLADAVKGDATEENGIWVVKDDDTTYVYVGEKLEEKAELEISTTNTYVTKQATGYVYDTTAGYTSPVAFTVKLKEGSKKATVTPAINDNTYTFTSTGAVAYSVKPEAGLTATEYTIKVNYADAYALTVTGNENANVEGIATAGYAKDAMAAFTVAAKAGYKLVSVKVGDIVLTPNADGYYFVKMDANKQVTIATVEEKMTVNVTYTDGTKNLKTVTKEVLYSDNDDADGFKHSTNSEHNYDLYARITESGIPEAINKTGKQYEIVKVEATEGATVGERENNATYGNYVSVRFPWVDGGVLDVKVTVKEVVELAPSIQIIDAKFIAGQKVETITLTGEVGAGFANAKELEGDFPIEARTTNIKNDAVFTVAKICLPNYDYAYAIVQKNAALKLFIDGQPYCNLGEKTSVIPANASGYYYFLLQEGEDVTLTFKQNSVAFYTVQIDNQLTIVK